MSCSLVADALHRADLNLWASLLLFANLYFNLVLNPKDGLGREEKREGKGDG